MKNFEKNKRKRVNSKSFAFYDFKDKFLYGAKVEFLSNVIKSQKIKRMHTTRTLDMKTNYCHCKYALELQ